MEREWRITVSTFFNKLDPDFDADAIEKLEADHIVQQRKLVPRVQGLMQRQPQGYPVSRDWKHIDCRAIGCMWNQDEKCIVPSLCKIGDDGKCKGFTVPPMKPQAEHGGD